MYVEPSASGPPQHIHPNVEEHFQVLSGELQARLNDKEQHFHEGEDFTIPPGTPHSWWNDGDKEATVLVQMRPGKRMQEFFETWYGLAEEGKRAAKYLATCPDDSGIFRHRILSQPSSFHPENYLWCPGPDSKTVGV